MLRIDAVLRADSKVGRAVSLRDRARLACASASAVALLVCARPARADDPAPEAQRDEGEAPPPQRPPDRAVPDYDGLPEPGDDAGDVGLWTARVLTSPLYLLTEYGLRIPTVWGLTEGERTNGFQVLHDFFTFGPDDHILVLPTVFYEFGFQPSIGVFAQWDEFLFPSNHITAQVGWGGDNWRSGVFNDRIELRDGWNVGARFLARERPDYVFGGIGVDATVLPRARFGARRIEPSLWSATRFWQSSDLELGVTYRSISFFDQAWGSDPSVVARAMANGDALPYGYATGYDALSAEVHLDVDTRTPYAPPEGGVRIAVHAGMHGAFGGLPELDRWLSWGGTATFAADLLGGHRVLGITADAHLITQLSGSNVPFVELIELGGARGLLPGYWPGHIQGFSAAGLTAHYTWPIWAFLDARLYFGTANAFGYHFQDFDVAQLRMTFGIEISPRIQDVALPFTFNFAFATDTFERGADMNSFSLAVGAREVL